MKVKVKVTPKISQKKKIVGEMGSYWSKESRGVGKVNPTRFLSCSSLRT